MRHTAYIEEIKSLINRAYELTGETQCMSVPPAVMDELVALGEHLGMAAERADKALRAQRPN